MRIKVFGSVRSIWLRGDHDNHKNDLMDGINVSQNLIQKQEQIMVMFYLRTNWEKFCEQKCWFIITNMLKYSNCDFRSVRSISLRGDHGNHKNDQMDAINVCQNLIPEARANKGNVLPQNQLWEVLWTEVLVHLNKDAEVQPLLDGKKDCKMTEKGTQYWLPLLEKKQAKLVARTIRKSSEIDEKIRWDWQSNVFLSEQYHCERAGMTQLYVQDARRDTWRTGRNKWRVSWWNMVW